MVFILQGVFGLFKLGKRDRKERYLAYIAPRRLLEGFFLSVVKFPLSSESIFQLLDIFFAYFSFLEGVYKSFHIVSN